MDVKTFLINDMQAEKDGYIAMIRNNEMTEDEKKVINQKIDALDERIAKAKTLENDNALELEKKLKEMNSKFDAVKEKLNNKGVKIEGLATTSDYLKSQNAVDDFAECLKECSEKTPLSKLWGAKLAKNDITFDGDATELSFIPVPVQTYISDTWEKEAGAILREFKYVAANRFPVALNVSKQDAETSRAKGHTKGNEKQPQTIELVGFEINTQYVYKLQSIYNKMVFASNGALIQYVIDELMTQWSYEVLRAILIGDGRNISDPNKINSIVPLYVPASGQAAMGNDVQSLHGNGGAYTFVHQYSTAQGATETTLEYIMDHVVAPIEDGSGDILLFINKNDYQAMRKFINGTGGTPVYMNETQLADAMGVRRIVITDYLDNSTSEGARAIAVHANRYAVIGSLNPEFISWENYIMNERLYRVEMLVGGDAVSENVASVAINA